MTRITRKLVRETETKYRGEPLVVELLPRGIWMWPKGQRRMAYVAYDAVYDLALKLQARRRL